MILSHQVVRGCLKYMCACLKYMCAGVHVCVCVCVNSLEDCGQNLNSDYLCILGLHLNFTFSPILLLWLKLLTINS